MNETVAEEQMDFQLLHYWQLVRCKLWLLITAAIIVTVPVFFVVKDMPPVYEATVTLLMAPEQVKTVSMGDMFGGDGRGRGTIYFNTQIAMVKSKVIMEKMLSRLELEHPSKSESPGSSESLKPTWLLNVTWLKSKLQSKLKSMLKMNKGLPPSEAERKQYRLETMKSNIMVQRPSFTKLMKLSYQSSSPVMVAAVVNTLAEVYIRDNLESRVAMAHQATVWMRQRADVLKQKLDKAEEIQQAFIEKKGLVNIGAGVSTLTSQELTSLTGRTLAARAKVSELSQRYGFKHPKLIAAKLELARAQSALNRGKSKIRVLGRQGVKLKMLQHEVDSTRELYETFINRIEETEQASTIIRPIARIVEPAVVPLYPNKSKKRKIMVGAFVLPLLAGIGLILLLDMLDSTIHSIKQVETKLKMPMLGLLPLLKFKSEKQSAGDKLHEMANGNHHQFNEAIRTIRTGIMLSAIDNPHKVILVTSSVPGEGKSTLAANLAVTMGKLERVLLLDADLRRPTVGKHFGMNTKERGLSELVSGAATFKDCLERNEEYNIDVMHAGIIPPNPLELLASNRFKAVLKSLENHYDRIIIDSTPVQAVSDALVLSQYVKGVVYVVKADATPDRVIKNCFKRLQEVNAPIIGVVLNQVDIKKSARHGYEDYEGYYDHYGYSVADEKV